MRVGTSSSLLELPAARPLQVTGIATIIAIMILADFGTEAMVYVPDDVAGFRLARCAGDTTGLGLCPGFLFFRP